MSDADSPGDSDAGVLLVAELHGRAALAPQLRLLLEELADASSGEQGCTSFRVLAAAEPGELVTLGCWASEADLSAHYDTAHYRRYRERAGELLARPSDVVVHRLSSTVHALDPNPPDPGLLG
jgi:quinol monooxygenase YgiN